MKDVNLAPNVCALCNKEYEFNLNVMRIIRHEENLFMDVPLCVEHWNEGKELRDTKISRLFIQTN